jgi:hypothetical protein
MRMDSTTPGWMDWMDAHGYNDARMDGGMEGWMRVSGNDEHALEPLTLAAITRAV